MENKYICVLILIFGLCHGVSKASECTARGRFPNDDSENCRGYTMCLQGGVTAFTQYKLQCPMGFVYSHLETQCTNSSSYLCYPTYNCTAVGNIANPNSKDCSSYIACVESLDGISTARLIECPSTTLFNSTAGVCVDSIDYVCPTLQTNVIPVVDDKHIVNLDASTTRNSSSNLCMTFSMLLSLFVLVLAF